MDYPAWIIGGIGPGWIIGLIATFHVLVSHFAVGGGIFLPFTEAWARKHNDQEVLGFLKKFSRFFLILTNVFGAISGVGIWFAIGLISPQATSTLIRLFVFIWAAEWVVFLAEIVSLIFYYYGWERMSPKLHLRIGWIYALTAWLSLFTINGILTFMLTPGSWPETGNFFEGYFNPGFWPSLAVRTLLSIALAGVLATFVVSRMDRESPLRERLLKYISTWLVPSYALLVGSLLWYYASVSDPVMNNLLSGLSGGVGKAAFGNMAIVTRTALLGMVATVSLGLAFFVSAYLNPREFTYRKSALLLSVAAVFVVCFEYSREMLRKPYVIRDYMYSNGIIKGEMPSDLHASFTKQMNFKPADASLGEQMFVGQCMSCHTIDGYRSLSKRLKGRDAESIYQLLAVMQKPKEQNPYSDIMPPLVGTEEEVRALSAYLEEQVSKANAAKPDHGDSKKVASAQDSSENISEIGATVRKPTP